MALCRVTSSPATAAKKTTKLGYSALEAGSASLPVTVMMLFFAAKSGELAQRIGPRLQMTVGPLVVGVSFLLMARIEPDSGYLVSVLPAVVIFGVGLVITVAPLTATVLAAVEPWAGPIDGTRRSASRHPFAPPVSAALWLLCTRMKTSVLRRLTAASRLLSVKRVGSRWAVWDVLDWLVLVVPGLHPWVRSCLRPHLEPGHQQYSL